MNHYTFELIAQHRPEVLERVLRVIRLRGFTVTNGHTHSSGGIHTCSK